jgi:FKBP-type peptidyl-prolyl cis-trans isomerase 2
VEGEELLLDANHPLAGVDLEFEVEVLAVRVAGVREAEREAETKVVATVEALMAVAMVVVKRVEAVSVVAVKEQTQSPRVEQEHCLPGELRQPALHNAR